MTLPVSKFDILDFDQVNPMYKAMRYNMQNAKDYTDIEEQEIANRYAPEKNEQEIRKQQLLNELMGVENKYAEPNAQANLGYKQAQTKRENALANLPFGGMNMGGTTQQVIGLEMLKNAYGEDSPQYKTAKNAFDLQQQSINSRIGYQDALTSSMPNRYVSPLGRAQVEEARVRGGYAPTGQQWDQAVPSPQPSKNPLFPNQQLTNQMQQGGNPYVRSPDGGQQPAALNPQQIQLLQAINQNGQPNPPQQPIQKLVAQPEPQQNPIAPGTNEELGDQYALGRQKTTTDVDTRKRNLFATNIDKTLESIDVDALTKFGGIKGQADLKIQMAKDAAGLEPSKDYLEYKKNVNLSGFLANQVRQFYGSSIQPSEVERITSKFDPANWSTSPKTAKEVFNSGSNLLKTELQTYRDALKSKKAYQGVDESISKNIENKSSEKILKYNPETGRIE